MNRHWKISATLQERMLTDNYHKNDTLTRRYYVGITRAKKRLFIHTNGNFFDYPDADQYTIDTNQYAMPQEIKLQLTHKDVYLDFFKGRKQEVLSLKGGDPLNYQDFILYDIGHKPVAKLSANMQQTLLYWKGKGYEVKSASVRFIVAWKPKDAPKEGQEIAVLLADLTLIAPQH